jgi:hypothetical protein
MGQNEFIVLISCLTFIFIQHHGIAAGIGEVAVLLVLGLSHSLLVTTDTRCVVKIYFKNNLEAFQFSLCSICIIKIWHPPTSVLERNRQHSLLDFLFLDMWRSSGMWCHVFRYKLTSSVWKGEPNKHLLLVACCLLLFHAICSSETLVSSGYTASHTRKQKTYF